MLNAIKHATYETSRKEAEATMLCQTNKAMQTSAQFVSIAAGCLKSELDTSKKIDDERKKAHVQSLQREETLVSSYGALASAYK